MDQAVILAGGCYARRVLEADRDFRDRKGRLKSAGFLPKASFRAQFYRAQVVSSKMVCTGGYYLKQAMPLRAVNAYSADVRYGAEKFKKNTSTASQGRGQIKGEYATCRPLEKNKK